MNGSRLLIAVLCLASLSSCEDSITKEFYKGELLVNGDFESLSNGIPEGWTLVDNSFGNQGNSITSVTGSSGQGLRFTHQEQFGCFEMWIEQDLSNSKMIGGQEYELTFDYLVNIPNARASISLNDNFSVNSTYTFWFTQSNTWQSGSIVLSTQSVLPQNSRFRLHFCIPGVNNWSIDELSLKAKP